jgi:hypothetical protein
VAERRTTKERRALAFRFEGKNSRREPKPDHTRTTHVEDETLGGHVAGDSAGHVELKGALGTVDLHDAGGEPRGQQRGLASGLSGADAQVLRRGEREGGNLQGKGDGNQGGDDDEIED